MKIDASNAYGEMPRLQALIGVLCFAQELIKPMCAWLTRATTFLPQGSPTLRLVRPLKGLFQGDTLAPLAYSCGIRGPLFLAKLRIIRFLIFHGHLDWAIVLLVTNYIDDEIIAIPALFVDYA